MWTSGNAFSEDLLCNIVRRIASIPDLANNIRFIFQRGGIGTTYYKLKDIKNVEMRFFDYLSYTDFLRLMKVPDVVINPMVIDDLGRINCINKEAFFNAKSEMKYIYGGVMKKCVISSPQPSYCYAINHGKTGFICNNIDEWIDCIAECVSNRDMVYRIGMNAYIDIKIRYNVASRVKELFKFLGIDYGGIEHVQS
ncbi:MAG: hypothetical protein QXT63_02195 [Thermoplasmata archaeon]